jgi:hypothetical protein
MKKTYITDMDSLHCATVNTFQSYCHSNLNGKSTATAKNKKYKKRDKIKNCRIMCAAVSKVGNGVQFNSNKLINCFKGKITDTSHLET